MKERNAEKQKCMNERKVGNKEGMNEGRKERRMESSSDGEDRVNEAGG